MSSTGGATGGTASTAATRRGRRPAGGTLRRRRGEVEVDSSDEDSTGSQDLRENFDRRRNSDSRSSLSSSLNTTLNSNSQSSRQRAPASSDKNTSGNAGNADESLSGDYGSSPSGYNGREPSSAAPSQSQRDVILEDADSNTLRIMISTDNHVGYAENDNIRGNDSFAALEEVLYLAKEYGCDMVLLAGDLFHENRPSRRTLIKTSEWESN